MATLTGNTIASTYALLLKIDSTGIAGDGTLRKVEDGDATDSALSLSDVSIAVDATDKIFLDGGTHSYIHESASDVVQIVAGGTVVFEGDTNSRISLSNNDSGASNTIFGKSAGDSDGDGDNNVFIGELSGGVGTQTDAADGNVGVGTSSLEDLTQGTYNVGTGYFAGRDITTGIKNTMCGAFAGYSSLLVDETTLLGYNAGGSGVMTADADGTVAIGFSALGQLTTGARNLAIGYNSIAANTTGGDNIMIGYNAAASANDAGFDYNIGIGNYNFDGVASGIDATGNTAIGHVALSGVMTDTSDYNTAVGFNAGADITSAAESVFIGAYAGDALTSGTKNTALGVNALSTADTALYNTAVGFNAMSDVAASQAIDGAVAIGYEAMKGSGSTTTGANYSIAIGKEALKSLTTGAGNTAVGYGAAQGQTTGGNNTAIGYGAMDDTDDDANVSNSNNNVFIGKEAGSGTWVTAESNYNTAIGNYTMNAAMNGALSNTALGYGSLNDLTTGGSNTSIGMESLYENIDGSNNVAVGYRAGEHDDEAADATSPDQCIIIGAEADFETTTPTNEIVIGYDANGKGDNTATIGNAACTAVYMADDSGATVHADKYLSSTMPAFMVHPSNPQTDIAEDSPVTVVFDVESGNGYYDQGGNFASNTFTAPVDGKYQLNCTLRIDQMDTGPNYYQVNLETSNHSFPNMWILDPGVLASDPNYWAMSFAALVDMDATDTAHITFYQDAAGTGGQTDLSNDCTFSGYLVC